MGRILTLNSAALNIAELSHHHRCTALLLADLAQASDAEASCRFEDFMRHLAAFFAREEALMVAAGSSALARHAAEHQRIMALLRELRAAGPQAQRQAVRETLWRWLQSHLDAMRQAVAEMAAGAWSAGWGGPGFDQAAPA